MSLSEYFGHCFWGPRRETPEAIAERFNTLIDRLGSIDPAFGKWIWHGANKSPIAFARISSQLAEQIAAAIMRGDDGEPEPIFGYRFGVLNSLTTTPRSLSFRVCAGSWYPSESTYSNSASFKTGWHIAPDPTLVTYHNFREVLLAIAECFDVIFGMVCPKDLMPLWRDECYFRFGWINYVAPRFAHLVTPPETAIVEHRPNGALLMSATDETFVTANPQHFAVARDIERALAPLEALPWPLYEEAR